MACFSSRRSRPIRAFEAAARHASFTKAAEELGMTQAAVSYQIKVLEERVGAPLFLRRPRQVVLTEAGQRLAPAVTEAFALIARGLCRRRAAAPRARWSSARVQTFASNWLARHLGSFQIAHPVDRGAARYVEPPGRFRPRGNRCRHPLGRRQLAGP